MMPAPELFIGLGEDLHEGFRGLRRLTFITLTISAGVILALAVYALEPVFMGIGLMTAGTSLAVKP